MWMGMMERGPLCSLHGYKERKWRAQCLSYDEAGTGKKSIGYKESEAAEHNVAI